MSKHHTNNATREKDPMISSKNIRANSNVTSIVDGSAVKNVTQMRRPVSAPASAEESIRRRAYELYEKRGGGGGHAEEDWLRAEAEVLETVSRARVG